MAQPNGLLRAHRERTPSHQVPGECMSRRELAEAVNVWLWETTRKRYELDAHTIARYERGTVRWPGAAYRSGLRHVLWTTTDAELGFWPVRHEAPPAERRREPTDLGQSWELAGPFGVAVAPHLELVTQTHRRLYHSLSSIELVAAVTGHLQLTALMLAGAQRPPLRRRLAAIAGETAGHAAWLFHDLGDQTTATRYYAMADAATREAGDPVLDAYVRGFRSLAAGSDGQARQALVLARDAVETAGNTATATTRAWLAGLEARALASVGERKACSATLEVLVELARVRARQQDVDEAAGLARESLAIAVETGSMAGIRHVQRFRPELARWTSTQSIRVLDEQLDGVG